MLEFHLSTILWTVINLLVLYLFLRKFLFAGLMLFWKSGRQWSSRI